MILQSAITVDVRDINSLLFKRPCDEERPMAIERLALRAQERNSVFSNALYDTIQTTSERLRYGDTIVTDTPINVAGGVIEPTAKCTA